VHCRYCGVFAVGQQAWLLLGAVSLLGPKGTLGFRNVDETLTTELAKVDATRLWIDKHLNEHTCRPTCAPLGRATSVRSTVP
jgi:hypothetical protein